MWVVTITRKSKEFRYIFYNQWICFVQRHHVKNLQCFGNAKIDVAWLCYTHLFVSQRHCNMHKSVTHSPCNRGLKIYCTKKSIVLAIASSNPSRVITIGQFSWARKVFTSTSKTCNASATPKSTLRGYVTHTDLCRNAIATCTNRWHKSPCNRGLKIYCAQKSIVLGNSLEQPFRVIIIGQNSWARKARAKYFF